MGTALRRVAAAAALVALTLPVVVAAPVGAEARRAPPVCARAQAQWARIVASNARVKAAFERASALRAQLNRSGRTQLGHRLDTRLQYLQSLHANLVARVALIAARVQGRCSAQPPVLPGL